MTVPIGASGQARVGIFPLSWSWYLPIRGGAAFIIGAGVTMTRDPLVLDILNNTGFGAPVPGDGEVVVGFEESFTMSLSSAGALGVTLRRQFSMDSLTWFLVQDTALAPNASTSTILAGNLLRFPAFPLFRYQLINLDGVNAQTVNGVVTLRAR